MLLLLMQNIQQIENLLNSRTPITEETGKPFNIERIKFSLGQWIDIKDTSGEWLEGQICKIEGDKIQVHYYGWTSIWDEWIDNNSSRISIFRTHTVQSPITPFLSPFPLLSNNPEEPEIALSNDTFDELFQRYCNYLIGLFNM